MRLFVSIIFFSSLISYKSIAQSPEIYFKHLTINEGLPSNDVLSIFEDFHGFMWFGTNEGLARYDGYSIQSFVYDNADTIGLSNNTIQCLAQDNNENLWIGTKQGLNCLDLSTMKFKTAWKNNNKPLIQTSINCLLFDSSHKLWVGTDRGLFEYDSKNLTFLLRRAKYNEPDISSSNIIYSVCEGKNNKIWVGTKRGLDLLNPGTGLSKRFLDSIAIKDILCDSKGSIWILQTINGTQSIWHSESSENVYFIKYNELLLSERTVIDQITEDKQGNYWLAIRDKGTYFLDKNSGKWMNMLYDKYNPSGINSNVPQTIYSDSYGNVWIGSYDMGVDFFDIHK